MNTDQPKDKKPKTFEKYGANWKSGTSDIKIEMACIQAGGEWVNKAGVKCGNGLFFHYKAFQKLLWPEKIWHRWNELLLNEFTRNRSIAVLGPASSGKTREACDYALCTYFCFPNECTILCSSTTLKSLEKRIWGEIVKNNRLAKERYEWLPGTLLEYKHTIVTEQGKLGKKVRDFRNGLCGIPCKKGESYVGLGDYVGIKNKKVILIADELQFLPRAFIDAISNLGKNLFFQCIGLGNPKDRTDALGSLAEPSTEMGGWEAIDQTEKTRTWPTRIPGGICVQLVGTDSPNFEVPEDAPIPYPFMISRESIKMDLAFYGRDSLQFSMMNLGMMPSGSQSRRVITRRLCEKFKAMEQIVWDGSPRTKIYFMDAAYSSIGGDRTVGGIAEFGKDVTGKTMFAITTAPYVIVVSAKTDLMPEDQIAMHIKDKCNEMQIEPQNVFYDGTGRSSLTSSFARIWSPFVNPIEFGGRATDRPLALDTKKLCSDQYGKFVTELWFSVRNVIESDQFRGMTEEILEEGCMREWTIMPSGKTDVEPKDKTKLRMGRSPDIFDALVCGVEGARRKGFMIEKLGKGLPQKNSNWFHKLAEKWATIQKEQELSS